MPVAFRGVVKLASVGRETDALFPFRSAGDAAGGFLLHRGHEDVAAGDEGHFLSVGGDGDVRGAEGDAAAYLVLDGLVFHEGDVQLAGLLPFAERVEIAVVGEEHHSVAGDAQVAHGMSGELRNLPRLAAAVDGRFPDIEIAALLAEVVIFLRTRGEDGIAVLALEGAETGELPLGIHRETGLAVTVAPYVMGDGGDVVFAEWILIAFVVLVQDRAVRRDAEAGEGEGGDFLALAAREADLVDLASAGEGGRLRVGQDVGAVQQGSVRQGGQGSLRSLPGRQLRRGPAGGRNDPDVLAAFAERAEHQLLAVGTPDRIRLIVGRTGDLPGFAALDTDRENIPLVAECDSLPVRGNGAVAQPAGCFLGVCGEAGKGECGDCQQECLLHACFF